MRGSEHRPIIGRVIQRRKSPKARLKPMPKWVPMVPIPVDDWWAEQFHLAQPKKIENGSGHLQERDTKLADDMVAGIPIDAHWWIGAMPYSYGEAHALASHISRGGYGHDIQVRYGKPDQINGLDREHIVLIRRMP